MTYLHKNIKGIVFHTQTERPSFSSAFAKNTIKTNNLLLETDCSKYENDNYIIFLSGYISINRKTITGEELLNIYTAKKQDFLADSDGNFIILSYTKKNHELKIINSRHNSYRIYLYEDNTITAFASSIKELLSLTANKPVFNKKAIGNFLTTGFNTKTEMQHKNISRLQACHYISLNKPFAERKTYWNMPFSRKPFSNTGNQINTYEKLFRQSISEFIEISKTKELGCLLSGGQDTSMTFMYASQYHKKPVHTFTASFPYLAYDETQKAKNVSAKFKGINHTVEINGETLNLIPQMINTAEEPLSGGTLAIYACAQTAKDHIDAVITGDGGDTYWGEYYPVAAWNKVLGKMPYPIRFAANKILGLCATLTDSERLAEAHHVFSVFAHKEIYDDFFSHLCSYRQYSNDMLSTMIADSYKDTDLSADSEHKINFTYEHMFDNLIEAKILYGVLQYMNPPTEKSFNSFNINFHTPYNSKPLIDFINSLPEKALNQGNFLRHLTNTATKRILHKQLMLKYFPKKFVYGSQQSLDMPYVYLIQQKKHLADILLKKLNDRSWYNEKPLKKMFSEFASQKISQKESCRLKHHGYRIYSLLTLEVWAQIFLDGKKVPDDKTKLEDFLNQ